MAMWAHGLHAHAWALLVLLTVLYCCHSTTAVALGVNSGGSARRLPFSFFKHCSRYFRPKGDLRKTPLPTSLTGLFWTHIPKVGLALRRDRRTVFLAPPCLLP